MKKPYFKLLTCDCCGNRFQKQFRTERDYYEWEQDRFDIYEDDDPQSATKCGECYDAGDPEQKVTYDETP